MRKIANTAELQRELCDLLAYAQTKRPSRSKIARDLHALSMRIAGKYRKGDAFVVTKPTKPMRSYGIKNGDRVSVYETETEDGVERVAVRIGNSRAVVWLKESDLEGAVEAAE